MYKFTNGIVVFTEEDKENFLRAGLKLVEEVKDENNSKDKDRIVETKLRESKKTNSTIRKRV